MRSSGGGAAAAAVRMDPEAAAELARKGVPLLLLDVPQHTILGIDTQVLSVGPRLKGIKMAPPGPHFVYYCSPSRHGSEFAPTVGFFLTTNPSEVVVRKWHAQEERLVILAEEEETRYSEAVKHFEFDDQLGPYNMDSLGDWKQLSSYLSQSVIERLEPIGGEITIALETSWMDRAPCSVSGIDRTSLLDNVLTKSYERQEDLLLGELQFSFITFMMGQSLEAFMQWKALGLENHMERACYPNDPVLVRPPNYPPRLILLFKKPLHTRTQMFVKFIHVIYHQFRHGFQRTHDSRSSEEKGNSLFLNEAWFSRDIFLYSKDFLTVILEAEVMDADLLSWARKLKTLLETTFGWDLKNSAANLIDEDDDFAPVIVEMDGSSYS